MRETVSVIDITAELTDNTSQGADSAIRSVSRLEQAMIRAQKGIERMRGMGRIELTMHVLDRASKGMDGVFRLGRRFAGSVFRATVGLVDRVTAPFGGIMRLLRNPIVAVASMAGIGLGTRSMISGFAAYDQHMANIRAATGATAGEMDALHAAAGNAAGRGFSNVQMAQVFEYMASAGWGVGQIKDSYAGILDLINAAGEPMGVTINTLKDTIMAFGETADQAGRFGNILVATANSSNTSISKMQQTLKYAAPIMGGFNQSLESTAHLMGILADRGLKGSQAGTALEALMRNLNDPGNADGLRNLGIGILDGYNNMRDIAHIISDLRDALGGMDQAAQNAHISDIFDVTSARAARAFLSASAEDWGAMGDAVNVAGDAMRDAANIRTDSLRGDLDRLAAVAGNVQNAFMSRLAPHLRGGLQWLAGGMGSLVSLAERAADAIGRAISRAAGAVRDMTASPEWRNAGSLWDRLAMSWNRLIAEPFAEWWGSTGRGFVGSVAAKIGEGLGSALRWGISSLFGMGTDGLAGAAADGRDIGRSFARGFQQGLEGMDWGAVADGLLGALKSAVRMVFSNPVTGAIAGLWLGGKAMGAASGGYKLFKAGKGLLGSAGAALGLGGFAKKAAPAALPVAGIAPAGALGMGGKTMTGKLGGIAKGIGAAAGGIYGGITIVRGGAEVFQGIRSDDGAESRALIQSGMMRAGGTAMGAAIGTLILPGIGTAIGAGLGAIVGNFAGNRRMEAHARNLANAAEEKRAAEAERMQGKFYSENLRNAVHDLARGHISAEQLMAMKQEEIASGLRQRFGDVSLSLREIQGLSQSIAFGGMKDGMEAFAEAAARAGRSMGSLRGMANELGRLNWMAGTDPNFDPGGYRHGAEAFVAGAKEWLFDREFEITAAARLIGTGADLSGLEGIFHDARAKIELYGERLRAQFDKEGELNLQAMKDYQNRILEIAGGMNAPGAGLDSGFGFLDLRFGGGMLDERSFGRLTSELARMSDEAKDQFAMAQATLAEGLRLQMSKGIICEEQYEAELGRIRDETRAHFDGLDQRVSDFLTGMTERMFEDVGVASGGLPDAMQASIQANINPMHWTYAEVRRFMGIDSLADGAAAQMAAMVRDIAAMIPGMWDHGSVPTMPRSSGGTGRSLGPGHATNKEPAAPSFGGGVGRSLGPGLNVPRYADGGILTRPHLGLVAESGAEAVIPLSGGKRNRGLALWEQAGKMLGAEPIIKASAAAITGGGNHSGGLQVKIDSITVTPQIQIDGKDVSEDAIVQIIINTADKTADVFANSFALSLEKCFANMPVTATPNPA